MTFLDSVISKVSSLPVVETAVAKATRFVPIEKQINGAHLFVKARRRLLKRPPIHEFEETEIPDVSTLALEDIDVSNPFLYRQDKWRSYFKRLRDECPVHYQKNSPFGPFWSVTKYGEM